MADPGYDVAYAGRCFAVGAGVLDVTDADTRYRMVRSDPGRGHYVMELYDDAGRQLATLTHDDGRWGMVAVGVTATAVKSCSSLPAAVAAARMAADICNTPLPPVQDALERPVTLDDLVALCPGYGRVELQELLDVVSASGGAVTLTWTPVR